MHILQHTEICHRVSGTMQKSVISSTVLFLRYHAENRRRICVNMRFSTLFITQRDTVIARQLYITVRKKNAYALKRGFPGFSKC